MSRVQRGRAGRAHPPLKRPQKELRMEKKFSVLLGRIGAAAGTIGQALATFVLLTACTDDSQNQDLKLSSTTDAITGVSHPLDPLTDAEINAAIAAVQAKGYVGSTTFYPVIRLEEPSKASVLAWHPGDPISRK